MSYTLQLDEAIAVCNSGRVAAAVAAAMGTKVDPPPLPDEVRDLFDEVLTAPLSPAVEAKAGHDVELYAALGIGR